MSTIQPDDAFIIHREGKDYKATVDQFAKDINIHVDCCGDSGGGLDCQSVADCLANAPIDAAKYSFAVRANKVAFSAGEDGENYAPPNFPENYKEAHVYCKLCDPVDHHMLELGGEGHGYSGDSQSIFRIPGTYLGWGGADLAITAPPSINTDDLEAAYGIHPDILFVKDLKLWKGNYEAGVTTTEELFTTGEEIPATVTTRDTEPIEQSKGPPVSGFLQSDGHIRLQTSQCDNYEYLGPGMYACNGPIEDYGEDFFRIEFTSHNGEKHQYAFIVPKHYNEFSTTTFVDNQAPDIQIPPMEDK